MVPRGSFERATAVDERGQTLIDYQIGIAIFLLATAFLFLFLPSVFTPYSAAVDSSHVEQSDRIAGEVLDNITLSNSSNTLDDEATLEFFGTPDGELPEWVPQSLGSSANVTLVDGHGEPQAHGGEVLSVGTNYDGESTAATTRIVADASDQELCPETDTCRIEVLVWP